MLCNLVWKYIVWLSRNLLEIFLLPPFILTLIYEEAFQQLGGPATLKWFPWTALQGDNACAFPKFCPSSSFMLGKRRGEISMPQWNLKLWLVLQNNVNCTMLYPIYKTFSLLKRLLRACRHPPKSSSFWKPGIHDPVISCLRSSLRA